VLLDQAETPLFFLERELRAAHPDLDLSAVVGNVTDEAGVEGVFRSLRPHRVFHAAAYKHVPLMETNAAGAVKNNVVGTEVVARAAGRHGTDRFVLVSTDKAVRPANVMGATKRMAELLVLRLQHEYPETYYGAVRFGNVLGSQGSVIPIFREQLEAGEPLTVTHPEVTRYFMTIPEAVQLILQASLLPELRGRVAMLDMGEPVKIVDLAQNFLRLSGVPPQEGKSYLFTGLRAGEKLHEELKASQEDALETSIEKVRLLKTRGDGDWCEAVPGIVRRWKEHLLEGRVGVVEEELGVLFHGVGNGEDGFRRPGAEEEPGRDSASEDGRLSTDAGGSVKPLAGSA
jgi:FlaA1/EpsC-like NDP-sugar epimerase